MKRIGWLVPVVFLAPFSAIAEKSIDAGNFVYQGCIRAPVGLEIAGMTYYPGGDPAGPADGYPGSLYLMNTGYSGSQKVLEMTIPTASIQASSGNCPAATVRRSLTDVGCNLDSMSNEAVSGGLAYFNDLGGVGEKLFWTIYEYYNVSGVDHDSAGWMDMDLTGCDGAWGMTGTGGANPDGDSWPYHSTQWEDYIFEIHDKAWADTHLDGRLLIYGRTRAAGAFGSTTGPALYAAAPWKDGTPIPNNGNMNGQILLAYSGTWDKSNSHYFPALFGDPEYRPTDRWTGAAWIRVGNEDAIVLSGRKSLGPPWYGSGGNGCSSDQGYHGDPYEARWWFYDPSDLECVIEGTCDSWDPTPYAIHDPSGEIYEDDCFNDASVQGGAAFDDANDVFYFAENTGGNPVIHVYRVSGSNANYNLTVNKAGAGYGTITSSPSGIDCGVDCQEVYSLGTNVQLAALPDSGSYFAGWSGDGDCSDGTVVLTSDRNCIATFEQGTPPTFTLSLTTTGTGTGTVTSSPVGIDCGSDCQEDYNQGTVVQLAEAPDTDSVFGGWGGAADCNDGTVTMDADTSCMATFNEAPEALGIVAAYGFEEASGSTVTDASGQGNSGTIAGATWTSQGYFANALLFDGVNDMVTIQDANSLDLTSGMTLEAWVRPASLSGWRTAVLKESGSGLAYSLYAHDNAPQPAAYIQIGGDQSVTGGASLPLNSWSHLATTYDGNTLRLYVDGQQVGSRNLGGAISTTNFPLTIGGNTVWGEYFEGTIDEIRLYDRALTQTEIQHDMSSPVVTQQSEFTLNITRMGSGSGTVSSLPTGIDCGTDCSEAYDEGTIVALSAVADSGSHFSGWGGDGDCADGVVTLSTGVSCSASFTLDGTLTSDFCPAYENSPLYRSRSRQVSADPSNWISVIEGAQSGDEILLADGTYDLDQYAIQVSSDITIRSTSGNREAVLIQGQGYGVPSEGFMIRSRDVTLADLSMTGIRNHAISIKGEQEADATHVYNVHLYDIGTQHIKGTPDSRDGVIACSKIGYSPGGVRGDYINAIDIHGASDWIIRDNEIYNIWGDGTGCEVDDNCGTYLPGGGPAILLWRNASGNLVERNRILDSFRGIALGFDGDHSGGAVRNNFFFQSSGQQNGVSGDAGISIWGTNTEIDHNTVILGSAYPGAIEVRNSSNVQIRNNLLSEPIWNRGSSSYNAGGNKTNGTIGDLTAPGDPHLNPNSDAVDFSTTVDLPSIDHDIDGDSRPQGSRPDAGCDEFAAEEPPASYTLIVSRLGTGSGTVTSSPTGIDCGSDCAENYDEGTVVQLAANPAAGSEFTGWSGDADCDGGQLTMNGARSCNATFVPLAPVQHTLTVARLGSGSGTVTSSPTGINCGSDCVESYDDGTAVQLTATPDDGSVFTAWSGDSDCEDGAVTLHGDLACTAAFEPDNPFESKIVPGTSSSRWKKAKLRRTYQSMVAVCNPEYNKNHPPLAVRIRNAVRNSFEVKLERLDGETDGISGVKALCTVIEAGNYPASQYGVNIEAVRFTSTLTDRADSWTAEARDYTLDFEDPVVLGQVMTANDERFSVFWSRGVTAADPPDGTDLWVGKHVAEDPDFNRDAEEIGYVVIEAGRGTLGGTAFEAGVGAPTVRGFGDHPPYSYALAGDAPHPHAAVSMAGMKSPNGGWVALYGNNSVSPFVLQLAVDEDQLRDLERSHEPESIAYLIFEPAVSELFWDDFESGNATSWSFIVP